MPRKAFNSQLRTPSDALRKGFTLVEILIVVVILGILATIVIPQFSNASREARESALKDDLRYLRTQVQVYRAQHRDVAPGHPGGVPTATPTEAAFMQQMTLFTNDAGAVNPTATAVYRFGPYLTTLPANPLNGLSTVTVVANGGTLPAADGSTGWIYKPQTGQVIANVAGADVSGVAYADY